MFYFQLECYFNCRKQMEHFEVILEGLKNKQTNMF